MNTLALIWLIALVLYPLWSRLLIDAVDPGRIQERSDISSPRENKRITRHFLLAALIAGTVWLLLIQAGLALQARSILLRQTGFYVPIDAAYWKIPGLFAGLALGLWSGLFWIRMLFSRQYPDYLRVEFVWFPLYFLTIFKALFHSLMLLVLILVAAGLNEYTTFDEQGWTRNTYLQVWEQSHSYQEISQVYKVRRYIAPNGNILDEVHYVLEYAPDQVWYIRQSWLPLSIFEEEVLPYFPVPVIEVEFYHPQP